MTSCFTALQRRGARTVLLFCLGIGGFLDLGKSALPARPIEFSEPADTTVSTNVGAWNGQSTGLRLEEDQFKPNVLNLSRRLPNSLRPLPPNSVRMPNRTTQEKNWMMMSPDEMMQSMIQKDILKLPHPSVGELNPSASVDQIYRQMFQNKSATNRFGAAEARGGSGETNLWGSTSQNWNSSDPFAVIANRRPETLNEKLHDGRAEGWSGLFKSGEDMSPNAIRERKAQAEQMSEYKKFLGYQTPGANSAFPDPSEAGRSGNALTPLPENSFSSLPVKIVTPLTLPSAPVAPLAPFAPGQSSLTPATYSPPPKPKSLIFTAPQRKF